MAKNSKKCKNPKNVQMRIDPHSSPMMLMIIFDGKNGPKTRENSHIWQGWVKIGEKTQKMRYFFRPSVIFFVFWMKWLVYMYTKGFWIILASYGQIGSKVVWGKCAESRIQPCGDGGHPDQASAAGHCGHWGGGGIQDNCRQVNLSALISPFFILDKPIE